MCLCPFPDCLLSCQAGHSSSDYHHVHSGPVLDYFFLSFVFTSPDNSEKKRLVYFEDSHVISVPDERRISITQIASPPTCSDGRSYFPPLLPDFNLVFPFTCDILVSVNYFMNNYQVNFRVIFN